MELRLVHQIMARCKADEIKDLSDAELKRTLGPCVAGKGLIRIATELRDKDIIHYSPEHGIVFLLDKFQRLYQWRLVIGCHRGTMMSRDQHSVSHKFQSDDPLLSLEDCKECAEKWRQNYAETGHYLWYANAYSPDKKEYADIVSGTDYR